MVPTSELVTRMSPGIVIVDAGSGRERERSLDPCGLATMAESEMRETRFAPPVRNCVAKAFVFTYKRAF